MAMTTGTKTPATLSAYGITTGLAGFDLVLLLKRNAFRKRYAYAVSSGGKQFFGRMPMPCGRLAPAWRG